ncbi:hypothetical protein PO909_003498 [Leuciscus waleckii]
MNIAPKGSFQPNGFMICMFHGGRDLEEYAEEFISASHLTICYDIMLMEGLWIGLDDEIWLVKPRGCWPSTSTLAYSLLSPPSQRVCRHHQSCPSQSVLRRHQSCTSQSLLLHPVYLSMHTPLKPAIPSSLPPPTSALQLYYQPFSPDPPWGFRSPVLP